MTKSRREILIENKRLLLEFDLEQWTQKQIHDYLAHGVFYEGDTVRALQRVLSPGDLFIDVGAHVGYFTCIGSALVGPMGKVIALEPELTNALRLQENVKLNRLENVTYFPNAAGASDGMRAFWVNRDNDGGHALWDVGQHDFNVKSRAQPFEGRVSGVKLDTLMKGRGPVRAIKIDTEGAEMEVLTGARGLLEANPECVVICEINRYALERMGSSEIDLRTFMERDLGYECWLIEQYPVNGKYVPIEPRRMEFGMTIDTLNVFNVMFKK